MKQPPLASTKTSSPLADFDLQTFLAGRNHDPFTVLGIHKTAEGKETVRVFLPDAHDVTIADRNIALERIEGSDFFTWTGPSGSVTAPYRLRWRDNQGNVICRHDPYTFGPIVDTEDLRRFSIGKHYRSYQFLGAHLSQQQGVLGATFATWAPNAERVSVVGSFNAWDGRRHPMRSRGESGVWELFIPDLPAGELYKFELRNRLTGELLLKSDPYARQTEVRPNTASVVPSNTAFEWQDQDWLARRAKTPWMHAPMSVYEVHLGSWRRHGNGDFVSYREFADALTSYVADLGFTHIELLPITEHPFDGSWGYQTTGFFAPSRRFGDPDDCRYFVDCCHQRGLGVILDWVPGHFPKDAHGLARYDGSPLYEHEDPRRGEHRDWGTLIFNYARNEVRSLLISSAMYWLEQFHMDGLRVDAVASMLYLDYSKEPGDWIPNAHGGNENLDAIDFLRELNDTVLSAHPGALTIAEESTSWPMVTKPTWLGGLGFSMKWNMGWMHDSLQYLSNDPIHRQYHHDLLTFGLLYNFSENFVLAFSHDEVVHGKGSLLGKMHGDDWQRFANLRLLLTYLFTYPGKKLLFMGNELANPKEWDHDTGVPFELLERPAHGGVHRLVRDLNRLYGDRPALFADEFVAHGFEWIDCHDSSQSTLSFLRRGRGECLVVCLNFTPVPRYGFRIGVPVAGAYREVLNSDSQCYGGSDVGNLGGADAVAEPWMGRDYSLSLTLPPLACIVLEPNAS